MAPWPRLLHHLDGMTATTWRAAKVISVPHTGDQLPEGVVSRRGGKVIAEQTKHGAGEPVSVDRWVSFAEF